MSECPREPDPGENGRPATQPKPRRRVWVAVVVTLAHLVLAVLLVQLFLARLCGGREKRSARDARTDAGVAADAAPEATPSVVEVRVVVLPGCVPASVRVRAIDVRGAKLQESVPQADGVFRPAYAPGSTAGLIASCPGLPSVALRLEAGVPAGALEMHLEAGGTLTVRVVDDQGLPIAGAFVAPDPLDPALSEGERRAIATADALVTGADGVATLAVRAAGTVEIVVEARDHVTARPDPIVLPSTAPIDVELPRGGRLAGMVADAVGKPRPGARVRVVGSGLWPAREFPAGADGRFDAGLLPPGFYEAEAFDETQISPLLRGIEIRPAEETPVQLQLAPGGFLHGSVTPEQPDVVLPAGLILTVVGMKARLVPLRVSPAADGTFRAGPLQPGRYLVRCSASPFLPATAWVDVAAGATAETALLLRPGRTLAGRVIGPDNAPVPGARLVLSGRAADGGFVLRSPTTEALALLDRRGLAPIGRLLPIGELGVLEGPLPPIPPRPFAWLEGGMPAIGGPGASGSSEPTPSRTASFSERAPDVDAATGMCTNERGEFEIAGLPPGTFAVAVAHPDFAPLFQEVVVQDASAPTTTVLLRLVEGCTLAGLVKDDAGEPVAGAAVRVTAGGLDPLVWQTDVAGAFTALHLPAHVTLRVQAPGFLATDLAQDLAGTPCTGQAELTLLRLGGRVAGRVLDSRRFPIRGARVRVEPVGGGTSWAVQGTMSAADGTFRLAAPASGAVLVRASHPDYVESAVETEPGEGIEVMLSRGVRILGTVTDDIALPVSATVALRRDGRELRATMTRPDGTFDAGRVAPGTYEVLAQAPGFADASVTIGVAEPAADAADTEQKVELALRRGVTLEGRIVDRFGDAVAGAQVEARAVAGDAPARRAVSDAEGRFAIAGLESGRYVVTAAREDLGEAEVDATLDVGTRGRPVELVFRDAVATPPIGGTPEPAQASGRVGYSWANDEVIVRTPAAYHPPGTDPLVAGDVIFQVERERVRDIDTLQGILGKIHRATISVAVLREGRRRFLTVDRPAMLADGW